MVRKENKSNWNYFLEQKSIALLAILYISVIALVLGAPGIGLKLLGLIGFFIGVFLVFVCLNILIAIFRQKNLIEKDMKRIELVQVEIVCLFLTLIISLFNYRILTALI